MAEIIIKDYTGNVENFINRAIKKSLTGIADSAVQHAKDEISRPKVHKRGDIRPNIITGNLLNSIRREVVDSEKAAYVGTDVSYAVFVELGTSKSWAYPYLTPAATEHTEEYREIVMDAFSGSGG